MFRVGPNGTIPYSAPEVTTVSYFHRTMNSTEADIWSWGAVLYRMTYNVPPNQYYTPPCYDPPANQPSARDPHLVDVLRHTLVIDPRERPDAPWLAQHPYTTTTHKKEFSVFF
jgi:serine/threonine protein kinase